MKGKTHIMIGAVDGVAATLNYPLKSRLNIIGSAVIGSLIPNVDHPKSKLIVTNVIINDNYLFIIYLY